MEKSVINYYLALDTETTGLDKKCNVLTCSFILLDYKLLKIDSLNIAIRHDRYIVYPRAMEINGIDLVKHDKVGISLEEARDKITSFIDSNCDNENKNITIYPLGHNVCYDMKMLYSNGLISSSVEKLLDSEIDTLKIARGFVKSGLIPKEQSLRLNNLSIFLGVEVEEDLYHTSEYDTILAIEVFKKLKTDFLSERALQPEQV